MRDEIATFDARNITPEIRDAVGELLKKHPKSFEEKVNTMLHCADHLKISFFVTL